VTASHREGGAYDGSKAASHLDVYLADPEAGHLIRPWGDERTVTTLLLTTTGNRTGRRHTRPLIYRRVGDEYVVVASLGGAPRDPAWYRNLVEHPDCEVQVLHERFAARARTAEGDERDRLWAAMVELYPDYADYQANTERRIPVVVLTPLGPATGPA
jgi:deazaflavin-dependent oxidoreductase (nitroreductase family)